MKPWKIFWGIGFLLAAVFVVLDVTGVIDPLVGFMGEVSVFALILAFLLIAFIISRLIKGKIASIFFPLAFIFMLFEKNIAKIAGVEGENIIENWSVLLIALFLTIGFSILLSSKKKKKKSEHKISVEYNVDGAESNLGSSAIYVDCVTFTPARIENNLGACSVHFQNVESYKGGETLYVENNLGALSIHVPEGWTVKSSIETNLGGTGVANSETQDGPLLYIKGENNLGSISVKYV